MADVARAAGRAVAVVACIACAALAHVALGAGASGLAWAAVLSAPVIAWAGCLAAEARSRALWFSLPLALIAMIFLLERWDGLGFVLAYGLPHAAAYLVLLWYFGRSLRGGRVPVITRLARRIRGTLSGQLERYTRRLTAAWCAFFAAQLACSAALLAFAPLETWSFFVNVLNVPLVAAMFAGDYAYRFIRLRGERITPISRIWRALVEDAAASSSAKSR
jgi:uncharacterized membrane protein